MRGHGRVCSRRRGAQVQPPLRELARQVSAGLNIGSIRSSKFSPSTLPACSYVCSCEMGYELASDRHTCRLRTLEQATFFVGLSSEVSVCVLMSRPYP